MNLELFDWLVCPYSRTPLRLETLETAGDEVEYGLLRSEAGVFPIVAGIPILFLNQDAILAYLRAGKLQQAAAMAVMQPQFPHGWWLPGRWAQDTDRLKSLGRRWETRVRDDYTRRVTADLFPTDGHAVNLWQLMELAYHKYRIRPAEVFNYNFYRYGMPRHLVALSFIEAIPPNPAKPVLDLACGAGHITWSLARRVAPQRAVGLDGFFFSLYLARHKIAPQSWYVCADVNALPFRKEIFSAILCSDAFSNFGSKWASLREMERVTDRHGCIQLITLRNKLVEHLYAGRPLTPQGYASLMEELPHRMLDDNEILSAYLEKRGLPLAQRGDLTAAPTLSIYIDKSGADFDDRPAFSDWPHARGSLQINPLYVPAHPEGAYTLRYPSRFYEEENPEMKRYMRPGFQFSPTQSPTGVDELVQNCALLALPDGYLDGYARSG